VWHALKTCTITRRYPKRKENFSDKKTVGKKFSDPIPLMGQFYNYLAKKRWIKNKVGEEQSSPFLFLSLPKLF
jgi:hypothetical protein